MIWGDAIANEGGDKNAQVIRWYLSYELILDAITQFVYPKEACILLMKYRRIVHNEIPKFVW